MKCTPKSSFFIILLPLFLLIAPSIITAKSLDSELLPETIMVIISTSIGNIDVQLFTENAPLTTKNFLKYIDDKSYLNAEFFRVVRPDNDNGSPKISVIQANITTKDELQAIKLETTETTGIKHLNGTLSMARGAPNTATSSFFICINPQPSLDFGGERNPDNLGFAAFGRVVNGMDIVKKINTITKTKASDDEYLEGQLLSSPIVIKNIYRKIKSTN